MRATRNLRRSNYTCAIPELPLYNVSSEIMLFPGSRDSLSEVRLFYEDSGFK